MAEAAQPPPVSAQIVGNAFVNQYYQILHHSPELVHRFYQEISKLGRPEGNGPLSLTTTLQAINEKILSLNYGEFKAEIKSVDAQESFNGGVSVLVTGCLEGKDKIIQNFTQMFFLAPQAKGYFVLNDMFQFVGKKYENEDPSPVINEVEAPLTPQHECVPVEDTHISERTIETAEVNGEEEVELSEVGEFVVIEEEVTTPEVVDKVLDNAHVERETNFKTEEKPKKSYASILMVMKENPMPLSSPPPQRPIAKIPEQEIHTQESVSATETPAADIESKDNGNYQEGEAEGYSVYIKGLSLHATPAQLEEEFKKYGAIKHDGIQVRSNKQGYCFGFVEFEEAIAVEKAIEASPVMIGGRQASVEEKKSTNTRATFRGRSSSGRGPGFRNEGTRGGGRGNYGNGRGYNNDRSESNGRSEFGNRGNGRGGGGYNTRQGGGDGFQNVGPRSNRGGGGLVAKAGPPRVSAAA